MNNQFDELTKSLAQSRRQALRRFGRFGVALAGIALATLGLADKTHAAPGGHKGPGNCNHCSGAPEYGCPPNDYSCMQRCATKCLR